MASLVFNTGLANDYEHLFDSTVINTDKLHEVDGAINTIVKNQTTYTAVGDKLGIPWYFIAIIHYMEGSLDFKTHLHNGDPLTQRTVQVPKGRPLEGNPPYTWVDSAIDSLTLEGFPTWKDWSIPGMLFCLEKYNGIGYRSKGINTPYLWSYSNNYTSGKYTGDGVYSPTAVSKQCGAAVILKRMVDKQIIPTALTESSNQV